MRRWLILLFVALVAGALVANTIASSLALADIANRPILALTRDSDALRFKVPAPGAPAQDDEARLLGGQGILFGYSLTYALPGATSVTCSIRMRTLTCDGGWTAERAP